MARIPRDRPKFTYLNDGPPGKVINPAVKRIMRESRMKLYMKMVSYEGQFIFQRNARKGRRPNATRNSTTVRHINRIMSAEGDGEKIRSLPDRWGVNLEAYAPHAAAREFGWNPYRPGAPKRDRNSTRFEKYRKRTPATKRKLAERNLGALPRKKTSVLSTLERRYYKPYRGGKKK